MSTLNPSHSKLRIGSKASFNAPLRSAYSACSTKIFTFGTTLFLPDQAGVSTKSNGECHSVAPPSTRLKGAISVVFTPNTASDSRYLSPPTKVWVTNRSNPSADQIVHMGGAVGMAAKV